MEDRFKCNCGCGLGIKDMDAMFLLKLAAVERATGIKLKYTSAIRCKIHNKEVKGSETSSHLLGLAVDILIESSHNRFIILKALMAAGFTRIGAYKTFIHVDYDKDKIQEVIW